MEYHAILYIHVHFNALHVDRNKLKVENVTKEKWMDRKEGKGGGKRKEP